MAQPVPPAGEILTKTMLGTTATYEVRERLADGHVRVAVIEAPGLAAGYEFTITAEAAAEMQSAPATDSSGSKTVKARNTAPAAS